MSINDVIETADSGLVEVVRTEWLALLKSIGSIANELQQTWLTDLITGAENAAGHDIVTVEVRQAKAMLEASKE